MSFRDQRDADGEFLVSPDDFGEAITYHPHQGMGEASPDDRPINAVVVRIAESAYAEDGGTILPSFRVAVRNDSVLGISSDEIDTGGDQLSFPRRLGEAAETYHIFDVESQDASIMILLCR